MTVDSGTTKITCRDMDPYVFPPKLKRSNMSHPRVLVTGLDTLPDVTIGHVSSFLQFKELARLLKVSKSIQEAVYAGETVLAFPKEATDAAVIAMVTKFHNLKSVNLAGCSEVTDARVHALKLELELIFSRKLRERGGSGCRVAHEKARVKRGVLGAEE